MIRFSTNFDLTYTVHEYFILPCISFLYIIFQVTFPVNPYSVICVEVLHYECPYGVFLREPVYLTLHGWKSEH